MGVLSIKLPIRKKSGILFDDHRIYIYRERERKRDRDRDRERPTY